MASVKDIYSWTPSEETFTKYRKREVEMARAALGKAELGEAILSRSRGAQLHGVVTLFSLRTLKEARAR